MRRFQDNLYMFSMARLNTGRVVVCRSEDAGDAQGREIFKLLKIANEEISFFKQSVRSGNRRCIAVKGFRRGEERVVLIFGGFSASATYFFASELFAPVPALVRLLLRGDFGEVCVSDGLCQAVESADSFAEQPGVRSVTDEVRDYLYDLFACLAPERESVFRYMKDMDADLLALSEGLYDLARLVGTGFTCNILKTEDTFAIASEAEIFDGAVCFTVMLALSMLARLYTRDRSLEADLIGTRSRVVLRFCLKDADAAQWQSLLESLYPAVQSCHQFELDTNVEGQLSWFWVSPVYADVGLTGVKRRQLRLKYDQ